MVTALKRDLTVRVSNSSGGLLTVAEGLLTVAGWGPVNTSGWLVTVAGVSGLVTVVHHCTKVQY